MNINKRLLKEIKKLYNEQLQKPLLENDYLIYYNEQDMNKVHAIIKAPYDSVYRHKFIRLDFNIPENYPHSPPEVHFVNHDSVRIHPNMYEDGKCCASILNTWGDSKYEKWTSSMGIETILLTFHSFLDNNPYTYEPGGGDDVSYTTFVQYQSWFTCLIRYLQNEKIELFNQLISNYLLCNIEQIFNDLNILDQQYPYGYYNSRCFEIDRYLVDYKRLITVLQNYYNYIDFTENVLDSDDIMINYEEFINKEYICSICYDTNNSAVIDEIKLECTHNFHNECLKSHIDKNFSICPMCRSELTTNDLKLLNVISKKEWIINPLTKRKVKIGSRTYNYLIENGIINNEINQ
jgi:ubiquitin-protein ligase